MKLLINCSNLRVGGGIQVALSFLEEIRGNKDHTFTVVLSDPVFEQIDTSRFPSNFRFLKYNIAGSSAKVITGKDEYLSRLVMEERVEAVFTVFGPSYWRPECKHVIGFARPHYVYPESSFFKNLSLLEKIKWEVRKRIHLYDFKKNNDLIVTENPSVSARLRALLPGKKIVTVTNYYNQVFDQPELWEKKRILPPFEGFSLLTVSANYPHKNLGILSEVAAYLLKEYPEFRYRFILTVDREDLQAVLKPEVRKYFLFLGKLRVNECPHLYEQADAMILPTLLECFSANYPEAMRMKKPILTSKLDFAEGLCKEAALYFDPLNPEEIGDKIVELAGNPQLQQRLITNGLQELKGFDTYSQRAEKYLNLIS